MTRTLSGVLARWACSLELAAVPVEVCHAAKRHLLDGTGTALAGLRNGAAQPSLSVAHGLDGPPEAVVLGEAHRIGAAAAAFANGALVHAYDFDDTHSEALIHATAVVLPAVLAVGQQIGANGTELLAAAIAGYEVGCRIGAGAPFGFHARGLHATAVCGPFAAAAVTARLLRLSPEETTNALGIAGSSAGGLLEFLATGAATKQLHPGSASLAGILAARLAAAGAEGPPAVLEGRQGLYAALAGRGCDPARVGRRLGSEWETSQITLKPYPACQLMHAALDAGSELRHSLVVDPPAQSTAATDSIVALEAQIHPDSAAIVSEPAADKRTPRTVYDAKFSLPWTLAALLIDGHVGLDTYTTTAIQRVDVLALAGRIRTTLTAGDGQPAAAAPASLRAVLDDGRVLEVSVPCSIGGPLHPLTDGQLVDKFEGNAGGRPGVARDLAATMLGLEQLSSLDPVLAAAYALMNVTG